MPRNEIYLAVRQRDIHVFKYIDFPVLGKVYVFQFYRVHNVTVQTAPAASPKIKITSDMQIISFL